MDKNSKGLLLFDVYCFLAWEVINVSFCGEFELEALFGGCI
jgi:hypothetical protein